MAKRKPLTERLRNWQTVYPQDDDLPEGDLYLQAAELIEDLAEALRKCRDEGDEQAKHLAALALADHEDNLILEDDK